MIALPDNPVIRIGLRFLDRVTVAEDVSSVILSRADFEVSMYISDGPDAAAALTREAAAIARATEPPDAEQFLFVGNDPVLLRGEYIQIGRFAFRLDEVREYAQRGANIPLPDGGFLQAAIALFVEPSS